MKKIIWKIVIVLFLILLIGFLASRIYCFVIVNRVYDEINNFREMGNRYYAVTTVKNGENATKLEIFCRDNKVKYLQFDRNFQNIFFEFRNFDEDEKYFWTINEDGKKLFNQREQYIMDRNFIVGAPRLMLKLYQNNQINLEEFLNIYYIVSVKYENKNFYKIVTKYETIIIDKETYLPEYSCKNFFNSEGADTCKMEYFYEFEINTVTDENMTKM